MHTLTVIGHTSGFECYLDTPEEEARARYAIKEDCLPADCPNVKTYKFIDNFQAYRIEGTDLEP